jgi:NACHT domain
MSSVSSTAIEDIKTMSEAGQASMAYFYFDFRDANKQHFHDLIRSLLMQLSAHSGPCDDILLRLYEAHDSGRTQPSDAVLTKCLQEMLTLFNQRPTYLIIDALDECPNTFGIPSPRELVLRLVKELVELRLPHLHLCITSRPEIDIRDVLDPLAAFQMSLHNESGQRDDIAEYVKSVVCSDLEPIMRRWKSEDKDLVIETLSERADGM